MNPVRASLSVPCDHLYRFCLNRRGWASTKAKNRSLTDLRDARNVGLKAVSIFVTWVTLWVFPEFENANTYLVRWRVLVMLDAELDCRVQGGIVFLSLAYCLASSFTVRRFFANSMGLGA